MDRQTMWHEESGETRAQRIFDRIRDIDDGLVARQQNILDMSLLYGDSVALTLHSSLVGIRPEMRHNVLAGAVDTVVSEVIQTHRRPVVMSRGANYKNRYRCKKLTQCLDIVRRDNRRTISHATRDAILTGLGFVLMLPGDKYPLMERIWPGNIMMDDRACVDSVPRSIFIRRYLDRGVLKKRFPDFEEEIEKAPEPNPQYAWTLPSYHDDLVEVAIAFHLPSSDTSDDGCIVTAIENCELDCRAWKKQYYPGVFIRPVPPQVGFWGESIAKRAKPAQEELDKLILRVQQAMHLVSVPRVYVKRGPGGIPKSHLVNNIGAVIPVDEPPTFHTPSAMSDEVYNHIDRLERYIYATIGVSQMSAQSMKPLGLDSGAALRAFSDIQSRRFIQLEESVAEATMDLAKLWIETMDEMGGGDIVIGNSRGLKAVKWDDIRIEPDEFEVCLSVSNALPVEFSGRVQMLSEMFKSGTMDAYDMWSTIDNPDFEAIRDRYCAPKELIEKILDDILETGELTPPEPDMALEAVAIPLCIQKIQQAKLEGATEDDIEPLRVWLTQAQDLLQIVADEAARKNAEAQANAQAQMQMAAAANPAVPGPPAPPPISPGPAALPPVQIPNPSAPR